MMDFSFLTLLVCWISFSFFFLFSFFWGGEGKGLFLAQEYTSVFSVYSLVSGNT